MGVNSISTDESSPLVPMRCLLSLISIGNLILKLSAIFPRILNNKVVFISGWFLRLCNSSLFIFDEHFMTLFSVQYF